jgi:lantibiotic biosynthesis protein
VSTRSRGGRGSPVRPPPLRNAVARSTDGFRVAARDIGDRLVSRAIWDAERCGWTADQLEVVDGEWVLVHTSVDGSLYNGTAGIARFLLWLWQATGVEAYRDTAVGALARSWADVTSATAARSPGLFTGPLGTACVTVEAGRLLSQDDLVLHGLEIGWGVVDGLPQSNDAGAFDLIEGLAGSLVGCAFLATVDRSGRFQSACREIGRTVVAAGHRAPWGMSWSDPGLGGEALCGLAHGASGIALGLLEAWRITHDTALLDAASEAIRFEQTWFDRVRGDWRDNRGAVPGSGAGGDPSAPFWCHGASGIGLARLRGYQLTSDRGMLADAGAALRLASDALLPLVHRGLSPDDSAVDGNSSVCHGAGSLIELLTGAGDVLDQPVFVAQARRAMGASLTAVARAGGRWRCGVPGGDEHPGLMLGLSGIGMCLLRLHLPGTVPPASLLSVA